MGGSNSPAFLQDDFGNQSFNPSGIQVMLKQLAPLFRGGSVSPAGLGSPSMNPLNTVLPGAGKIAGGNSGTLLADDLINANDLAKSVGQAGLLAPYLKQSQMSGGGGFGQGIKI